ncbi:MAG: CvpA family protein [Synergistaceae bacterium]|nr:CvpA family protein [Synergistaceae bacterium]
MKNIALVCDLIMIAVFLFFLWRGFLRGFSGEIIGFVGLFVGAFCAWNFHEPALELVRQYLPSITFDDTVIKIICGVIIFFSVEIIFALISAILAYLVRVTNLTVTDRLLGIILACVKFLCVAVFIYAVASMFPNVIPENFFEQSYTMKFTSHIWPPVRDFLTAQGLLDFSKLTGKM